MRTVMDRRRWISRWLRRLSPACWCPSRRPAGRRHRRTGTGRGTAAAPAWPPLRLRRLSFDHGQVLTGWEVQPGGPAVYDVPPPHASLVDHLLGQAREPDYLIDLHHDAPPPVRHWLRGPARMRMIASAYFPADDANYAITIDPWRGAFDAILHVHRVAPSRLLPAGAGPS